MAVEQKVGSAAPDIQDMSEASTFVDVDEPKITGAPDVPYVLASNPFGHFCIPGAMADRSDAKEISGAGVPGQATLDLIRRKLGSGDLVTGCVGFGANLPVLHEALAPNAMIHAFEHEETASAAASFTAALNGLEKVHVHTVIAGKRTRHIPASRLSDNESVGDADVRYQMRKLDDMVPQGRYVSVIHLSSYGLEMPAVLGARRIVSDSAPMIVMKARDENVRRFFQSCLHAHFPDIRYSYAGSMDQNAIFVQLSDL